MPRVAGSVAEADSSPRLQAPGPRFAPRTRFIEDETSLSERLGIGLEHPVRLFDVDGLGVSLDDLRRQVLPSFAELPWDEYDAKRERVDLLRSCLPGNDERLDAFLPRYFAAERGLEAVADLVASLDAHDRVAFETIRPFRRRAMASFIVHRSRLGWEIEREPDSGFAQGGDHQDDYRRLTRRFAPSPAEVTAAPAYRALIARLAELVADVAGGEVSALRVCCHQMYLVPRPSASVSNAPEGVHQDGADYIVSALVLERSGIEGGESVVLGPDKRTEYLRHALSEGQGIFQADVGSPLWHTVTPVRLSDPRRSPHGARKILGYDLHLA